MIDYFQEYLYTFSYDENARILTSNYQYRYDNTPTDNEYTVNHLNTNTYSYTDDGLSFIPWFYHWKDVNLDGEIGQREFTRNIEYTYENGYLASLNYDYESTDDDDENHETQVFTYQDGCLKPSSWNTMTIMMARLMELNDRNNLWHLRPGDRLRGHRLWWWLCSPDGAQSVVLTYNADDTVTGTIITTDYGIGDPEVTTVPVNIDFSANDCQVVAWISLTDDLILEDCVTPSINTLLYYNVDDYIVRTELSHQSQNSKDTWYLVDDNLQPKCWVTKSAVGRLTRRPTALNLYLPKCLIHLPTSRWTSYFNPSEIAYCRSGFSREFPS